MPPPHLELDDLVRLPNHTLALVERLPASSDSESESDDSDDEQSITDQRGRLSNWVHQIAFPSAPTNLITTYDDSSTPAADDHIDETTALLEAQQYHPHQPIPEGSALVAVGLTGTHTLYPATSLTPVDRCFHPGSLVIRPSSRQSGIIQSVDKTLLIRRVLDITPANANQPSPQTVFQVQASELGLFSGLRSGDAVVRGNWVGIVDYFQEDVFVQFLDGAIACVPGHQKALRNVDPRTPDRKTSDPFREGLYYPGQRVRAVAEVWRSIAIWIRGKYTGVNEGVVKSVSLGDVGVEWVAKNMHADDADDHISFSPGERNVENVKYWDITPLDAFRGSDWVVGDRAFLINQDSFLKSSANPDLQNDRQKSSSNNKTGEEERDSMMQDAHEEDDGEWEEDGTLGEDDQEGSRSRPTRSGRLMKAHRRARELTRVADETGVVSESLMASPSASAEDVVQVLRTTTKVTVLWQDGSRSVGIPGLDLQRANHSDSYDFWPGQIVSRLDDGLSDDENGVSNPLKRRGILLSMDSSQRTAVVRWENEEGMQFEAKEEELSVYELTSDESNLNIGDVVLHAPIKKEETPRKEWVGIVTGHTIGKCTVSWYGGKVTDVPQSELIFLSTGDDDDSTDSEESSDDGEDTSIGEAVEHELDEDNDTNWGPDVDDDDGVSSSGVAVGRSIIRELVDDFRTSQTCRINFMPDNVTLAVQVAVEEAADMLDGRRRRREREGAELGMSHDDMRLLANFLVTRATSQLLFASLVQQSELRTNHHNRSEVVKEWETLKSALIIAFDSLGSEDGIESRGVGSSVGDVHENGEISEPMQVDAPDAEAREVSGPGNDKHYSAANGITSVADGSGSLTSSPLEKFMVVDDLADFHKFSSVPSGSAPSPGFVSVINKEWGRLRRSLPSGIIVRASEQNRDRIRAAIIGPKDTPYADIMFFFDILMGHKYPIEPPHVWFRSHGRRLNPNLYEDGKVCLSILGTWDGDSIESWDAKTSNLLRVLLSLQALVFVDEPYYNEAGYQKQRGTAEGHGNSQVYNESVFLLCIRHVIQTLKKGSVPVDCADMAFTHYGGVGKEILERCRKLVKLEAVGNGLAREGGSSDESNVVKAYSSCGFRRSLGQLIPTLEKALSSISGNALST